MLNETIIFRATDDLAEAIHAKAKGAGLSVSEYLRGIISDHVSVSDVESPICQNLATFAFFSGDPSPSNAARKRFATQEETTCDPMTALSAAGAGDTQAQRLLADMAIEGALGNDEVDPLIILLEGLVFARLADRHGVLDDSLRVVTMLALAATMANGQAAYDLAGEAIARLELIAQGGFTVSEDAAELLANCAAREHPHTMQIAQQYRRRLTPRKDVFHVAA